MKLTYHLIIQCLKFAPFLFQLFPIIREDATLDTSGYPGNNTSIT